MFFLLHGLMKNTVYYHIAVLFWNSFFLNFLDIIQAKYEGVIPFEIFASYKIAYSQKLQQFELGPPIIVKLLV